MKKATYTIIIMISHVFLFAQCPYNDIKLYSQESVDNFQINYPNCTELQGGLEINSGVANITNLDGLSVIRSIAGDLEIMFCETLSDISGLGGVESIGGSFELFRCDVLDDLSGMSGLAHIGGKLRLGMCDNMVNLTGVENLTYIGDGLYINNNEKLENLSGLGGLNKITGNMVIEENNSLISLIGIENLHTVEGSVFFNHSDALASFEGLNGLTNIEGGLSVGGINSIKNFEGFDNLTSIGGTLGVSANDSLMNLSGLESLIIVHQVQLGSFYHPWGDFFTSLNGLNNLEIATQGFNIEGNTGLVDLSGLDKLHTIGGYGFKIRYDSALINLSGIESLKTINGWTVIERTTNLLDFTGLDSLSFIGATFLVEHNRSLQSMSGLSSLRSIDEELVIRSNDVLTSLNGLEELDSIFEGLNIGGLTYDAGGNPSLTDLNGLESLDFVAGEIQISNNTMLANIEGIGFINPAAISNLIINNNPLLSHCDINSFCDYLLDYTGMADISANNSGCQNRGEVETACEDQDVDEHHKNNGFMIFPVPASSQFTLKSDAIPLPNTKLAVFNAIGRKVLEQPIRETETPINISSLKSGIYTVQVKSESNVIVFKLIKE